jgi:phosphate-selective porin OprO and OprP
MRFPGPVLLTLALFWTHPVALAGLPWHHSGPGDDWTHQPEVAPLSARLAGHTQFLQQEPVTQPETRAEVGAQESAAVNEIELAQFHQPALPHQVFAPPRSYPVVRLTGFFQADIGWIHQEPQNMAAVGDVQDGASFRRARLAATGEVAENIGYMVEFDFASPGRPSFMDVWLEVRDVTFLQNVRIGHFRMPAGLEALTSVKELTFLERGLPFALLPFRQIGVMAHGTNDREDFTWAAAGFRFPVDFYGGNVGDNGGYSLATRLTGLVIDRADEGVLHIGGSYSLMDPSNDRVRYFSQPEFFLTQGDGPLPTPPGVPATTPPFVDTGVLLTENLNLLGAELAGTSGPFHFESEAIVALVNRRAGDSVAFPGAYVQAGWFITGEHRPYDRNSGTPGAVVPAHPFGESGCGAWEVAARGSVLDLSDADVRGGRLQNLTLGLNWYLNAFAKFQMNYIHSLLSHNGLGTSEADIVAARAQVDF